MRRPQRAKGGRPSTGWFLVAEHLEGPTGWVKGGRRPSRSDAVGAFDASRRARMMGSGGAGPPNAPSLRTAVKSLGKSFGFLLNEAPRAEPTGCRRTTPGPPKARG